MKNSFFKFMSVAALTLSAGTAFGATVNGDSSGLVNPDGFVGFEEVTTSGVVTDQYRRFGVTFAPGISVFTGGTPRANFAGRYGLNFTFEDGALKRLNPLTIMFERIVSAATFASTNNGENTTVIGAYLGNDLVEEFTTTVPVPTGANDDDNVFGFTGIEFDRIEYDVTGGNQEAAVDSIAFDLAAPTPVPLPASMPMLLIGLGGFVALRRRKKS